MKRVSLLGLLLVSIFAFVLIATWPFSRAKPTALVSIIGKWHVSSDDPKNIQNHTYEFLANGVCVEKYRSEQMAGQTDMPSEAVWMDATIHYKYKPLGNNQYRLWPVRTQIGNQVNFLPMWTILNVTIIEDQAEVFSVSNQLDEMARDMIDDSDKKDSPSEQKTRVNPVDETWVRTS